MTEVWLPKQTLIFNVYSTVQGLTRSTTNEVTTAALSMTPVEGVCTNYLDYQNSLPQPLFTPSQMFLPEDTTAAIEQSGLCDVDLLPAACSLWYPPLPSSGFTLCQEACTRLFEGCRVGVVFFEDFALQDCASYPLRGETNGRCIGGKEQPITVPDIFILVKTFLQSYMQTGFLWRRS